MMAAYRLSIAFKIAASGLFDHQDITQHPASPDAPADVWNWLGVLPSVARNPSFACADETDVTILEQDTEVFSAFFTI